MPTRAAAAREAAFILSSTSKSGNVMKKADEEDTKLRGDEGPKKNHHNRSATSRKRNYATSKAPKEPVTQTEPVKGGWDELPHNMGKIEASTGINDGAAEGRSTGESRSSRPAKGTRNSTAIKSEKILEQKAATSMAGMVNAPFEDNNSERTSKQRTTPDKAKTAQAVILESSDHVEVDPITAELKDEFEDGFKDVIKAENSGTEKNASAKPNRPKRKRLSRTKKVDTSNDVLQKVNDLLDSVDPPAKRLKKSKANPYGLTPGVSPFPDFTMPTIEACKQVEDALSEVHGKVEAPKEIPAPSLEVTGCGEVPSVVDALVRTRLSASTTSQNAKYAFTGLVERYGVRKEGIGAGSVDWNKVRESDVLEIEKSIKKGGLAKTKSVSIKKILEMVHDLNKSRRDAFIKEKETGESSHILGADKMSQGQKDMEIAIADSHVLSLDFMHGLTADEAMSEFIKYPGIGVKTASCVILFCLQRPSFAVDTHVWRFCKWLRWVPEGATRDQTFSHCEVRIPDSMKYSLHQLFIRHGKTCPRCRAITGEGSEGWQDTICPLESLVERTGKRKAGIPGPIAGRDETVASKREKTSKKNAKEKGKKAKSKKGRGQDRKSESSDLSDLSDVEEPELDDHDDDDQSVGGDDSATDDE